VETLRQLVQLLQWIKQATGWLRWLTNRTARREAVRARYAEARERASSKQFADAVDHIERGVPKARQLAQATITRAEVVQDWRSSSADLFALLEQFVAEHGTSEEHEAARHGFALSKLSGDLVDRIESAELDLRLITRTLRPYQIFGAKFALIVRRSLLGDDMGLGKTVQALAAMAHAVSAEGQPHHVVVCPAALIDNWLHEITLTTTPAVIGLPFRQPGRQAAFDRWCTDGGILLTSYDQVGHLLDLNMPPIGFVVADEAHIIKNPATKRTKSTSDLARRGRRVLLMGGTLMENYPNELVALTAVADPARGEELRSRFDGGRTAHQHEAEFRRALSRFYLRRNQENVLAELPGIIATDEPIDVGSAERDAYEAQILRGNLMGARRALIVGAGVDSVKMSYLGEIVAECRAEGRKVLIFSYFLEALAAAKKIIGEDCLELRGGLSDQERQRRITTFENTPGFAAFALQIEVGGVGLNFQSASVVVLMEPQYKPTTEWQAIARAHRMGQTRRVVVHRFIATNSVDERIVELTKFKAELFDDLARRSDLAEASLDAMAVDTSRQKAILEEERRRLGQAPPPAA
jgi:SNF2 family DNA or RNA helicase